MAKPEHFILTGSGIIDLLDPEPHHFNVEEIALVLSRKPRFGGHGLRNTTPVNVAQHSVYVSKHFSDPVFATLALLHDAQEVSAGDVATPVKGLLRDHDCCVVDDVEDLSHLAIIQMILTETGITLPLIWDRYGPEAAYGQTYHHFIRPIDKACAASEALYLFGEHRREEIIECFGMPTNKIEVTPMTQWESEQAFLNRFESLRLKLESQQSTRATLTTQEDCTERNVALS
jgi:5'-deoxynucleotidase YfbR-like HD superfamily hydrolase